MKKVRIAALILVGIGLSPGSFAGSSEETLKQLKAFHFDCGLLEGLSNITQSIERVRAITFDADANEKEHAQLIARLFEIAIDESIKKMQTQKNKDLLKGIKKSLTTALLNPRHTEKSLRDSLNTVLSGIKELSEKANKRCVTQTKASVQEVYQDILRHQETLDLLEGRIQDRKVVLDGLQVNIQDSKSILAEYETTLDSYSPPENDFGFFRLI